MHVVAPHIRQGRLSGIDRTSWEQWVSESPEPLSSSVQIVGLEARIKARGDL
jgi:hypothetical protein